MLLCSNFVQVFAFWLRVTRPIPWNKIISLNCSGSWNTTSQTKVEMVKFWSSTQNSEKQVQKRDKVVLSRQKSIKKIIGKRFVRISCCSASNTNTFNISKSTKIFKTWTFAKKHSSTRFYARLTNLDGLTACYSNRQPEEFESEWYCFYDWILNKTRAMSRQL